MSNAEPTLCVHETFSSIQGESSYAGIPCFFIRLAGCNLRCSYCDTGKAQSFTAGRTRSVRELADEAARAGLKLVELTGGEPLAQKETPRLASALLDAGHRVLIETNGACDCSVLPDAVVRIVDFKTPSSGETARMRPGNFTALRPFDEVKFVIADRTDYVCACGVIAKYELARQVENILFSPVFGRLNPRELVGWMLADHIPARINLQFHKIIWGADAEGV